MNIINWDQVREKIVKFEWAAELYETMKISTDAFIETYKDDPKRIAGWGHNYHCDDCAGRLKFDETSPNKHVCSVCGKVNTGSKKDNAWTASYRGRALGICYKAGVLYQLEGKDKYPVFIAKVMDFFADNYEEFKVESPAKRFEGKLTGINLSDAVGLIQGIFGMDMARDAFSEEQLNKWHDKLFIPQADMYDQFSNKIYNIPAWMKAAEGIIGLFFNDEKIINSAFYSRFGIMDQMRRGVTEEGMWFEYSPHYHFYCAHPVTFLVYFAKKYNLEIPDSAELYKYLDDLYMFPIKNMFSNGYLPNPGDGWPAIQVTKYKQQFEYAAAILDNDYIKQVLGTVYEDGAPSIPERLLFNPGYENKGLPQFGSQNNPDSYSALLKNDISEVFLKTGIKTISHAHPDVMTMELCFYGDVVSEDLGSNGYSTKIFREWQHKTLSHNTIILDKIDQKYEPVGEGIWPEGIVEYYDENRIRAKSKNVYECCDYTRDLRIDGPVVYDEFTINGVEEYNIEWLFYCKGDLKCKYDTVAVDSLGNDEGYQHLFDIRKFDGSKNWTVEFELEDKTVVLDMEGAPETEVFLVNSYTTDFNSTRPGVIVRRKGNGSFYKAKYTCHKKGS